MFNRCDFILGDNDSIVIIVPTQLPKDLPLTVEVYNGNLVFKSGEDSLCDVMCESRDVLQRLANKAKVGLIEFLNGVPKFPAYITAVANIEVHCAA